ncbi:hypothetical protein [Ruegeria profundi]|uniref:Uncharacterized protein n=1 Tax=Ruegeria profundi TaxID=1685378 RepID=A0A0X3TQB9_9RHOB|nr:hypothetical protein [Ruegeria profundi]KUJ77231.1 hypothetical protein AVO44_17750 [Ruegeria profundi]
MTKFRPILITMAGVTLVLVVMAYLEGQRGAENLAASIPPPPEVEVPDFVPPELPLTGIEVTDRAVEFGPRSDAVTAQLQQIFYEVLEGSDGVTDAAVFAVIDAVRAAEDVRDEFRMAEIAQLHGAVENIRDDVERYQDSVQDQIAAAAGPSLTEILALAFAGLQSVVALAALGLDWRRRPLG